jgi:uncharacterized protein YjaG (DUF416 family)
MLQNPIHLRLEKLESWQHVTFMAFQLLQAQVNRVL